MTLFLGTLLITIACCLAMGIGVLLRGRPLTPGCGNATPETGRCEDCPHRGASEAASEVGQGDQR